MQTFNYAFKTTQQKDLIVLFYYTANGDCPLRWVYESHLRSPCGTVPEESHIKGCVRCNTVLGCDCRAYYITTNVSNVIYSYINICIVLHIAS